MMNKLHLFKVYTLIYLIFGLTLSASSQFTPLWKFENYFNEQFGGHQINVALFSQDGSKVYLANALNGSLIFDSHTGALITKITTEFFDPVESASFSNDGKRLITGHYGAQNTHIFIYDVETGEKIGDSLFLGNVNSYNIINSVALNEDGTKAYANYLGRLYEYDVALGVRKELKIPIENHYNNYYLGKNVLILTSSDGKGIFFDVAKQTELSLLTGRDTLVSEDRKWAVSFDYLADTFEILNLLDFTKTTIDNKFSFGSEVGFSPINNKILRWNNGTLEYYEIHGKSELALKSSFSNTSFTVSKDFKGDYNDQTVKAPIFSPDGKLFVLVVGDTAYVCETDCLTSGIAESMKY